MTKSVLVTGANGFVGGHLWQTLDEHSDIGHVSVLVRDTITNPLLLDKQVQYVIGDIMDKSQLAQIFTQFDIVIHLACYGDAPLESPKEIEDFCQSTRNIYELALEHRCGQFIYLSSFTAYGGSTSKRPVNEFNRRQHDLPHLHSANIKRKMELELLEDARRKERGMKLVTLAPTQIYGAGDYRMKSSKNILRTLDEHSRILPDVLINVVHVQDVVKAILRSIDLELDNEAIIIAGENIRLKDYARCIYQLCNKQHRVFSIPLWAARMQTRMLREFKDLLPAEKNDLEFGLRHWVADNRKMQRQLGIIPMGAVKALSDAVLDLRERGLVK